MAVASRTFYANTTWTAPAGVRSVRVQGVQKAQPMGFAITAGAYCVQLIDANRNLWSWGRNLSGQVGDGTVVAKSTPVLIPAVTGTPFALVAGSFIQGAGLAADGRLYIWGQNANGELGDGTVVPKSTPVLISGGYNFVHFGVGALFSGFGSVIAATTTGLMYSWGGNGNGILGLGDTTARSTPTLVAGGRTDWARAYGSASVFYGLTTSGALYAWGYNGDGAFGNNGSTDSSTPVPVAGGLVFREFYTQAFGAFFSVYGLTSDGTLYSWGNNPNGNLGVNDVVTRSSPTSVLGNLKFSQLAVAQSTFSVMGLTTGGDIYSWGSNSGGMLGLGDNTPRSSPVIVPGGLKFSRIVYNQGTGYGLTTAGDLYAWGGGSQGGLGDGTSVSKSTPTLVAGGLKWASMFVPSSGQPGCVYGVTTANLLYAWGLNTDGELGDGTSVPKSSPVQVVGSQSVWLQDRIVQGTFAVVPNTAYTIDVRSYRPAFGTNPLGQGQFDYMVISYDQ